MDTSGLEIRSGNSSPRWNPSAWFGYRDVAVQRRGGLTRGLTTNYDWQRPFQSTNKNRYPSNSVNHRNIVKSRRHFQSLLSARKHNRYPQNSAKRVLRINLKLDRVPNKSKLNRDHRINILAGNRRHNIPMSHSYKPLRVGSSGKRIDQTSNSHFSSNINKQTDKYMYIVERSRPHNTKTGILSDKVDAHTGTITSVVDVLASKASTRSTNSTNPTEMKSKINKTTMTISIETNGNNQHFETTSPATIHVKVKSIEKPSLSATASVNRKLGDVITETPDSLTTEEPDTPDGTELPEIESR